MLRMSIALICVLIYAGASWAQVVGADPSEEDKIIVPKSEYEAIKSRLFKMEEEVKLLRDQLSSMSPYEDVLEEQTQEWVDDYVEPVVLGGSTATGVPQTLLPDISVIGNVVGKVTSDRDDDERNSFLLREAEVAFQGYLYPQIRADVIIALEEDHGHEAELEEGYVSFLQLGNTDLNVRLGKMRLNFGKVNPVHPHQWLFVEPPRVVANFLGDHALIAQGASVGYLLPTSPSLFANLDVGAWRLRGSDSHEHDDGYSCGGHLGPGFDDRIYSGRLWTSRAMSANSELELGLSGLFGSGLRGGHDHHDDHDYHHDDHHHDDLHNGNPGLRENISLLGLDLTYRYWPAAHQRVLLRSEVYAHQRGGNTRFGYYLFGNYKWDRYWDAGLLYDWSKRPYPATGHDSGVSAILTNRLTETTSLRLQLTHGSRADTGRITEGFLQMVWGMGPHSHPLE